MKCTLSAIGQPHFERIISPMAPERAKVWTSHT